MGKTKRDQVNPSPELRILFAEAERILSAARQDMTEAIEWANGELERIGLGPMSVVFNVEYPSREDLAGAVTAANAIAQGAEVLSTEDLESFSTMVAGLVGAGPGANVVAKTVHSPRPGDPDGK